MTVLADFSISMLTICFGVKERARPASLGGHLERGVVALTGSAADRTVHSVTTNTVRSREPSVAQKEMSPRAFAHLLDDNKTSGTGPVRPVDIQYLGWIADRLRLHEVTAYVGVRFEEIQSRRRTNRRRHRHRCDNTSVHRKPRAAAARPYHASPRRKTFRNRLAEQHRDAFLPSSASPTSPGMACAIPGLSGAA